MWNKELPTVADTLAKHNQNMNKIKQAKAKKAPLPVKEAWTKIFGMNNSASDLRKLKEVYLGLREGNLQRESEDKTLTKAEALRLWVILNESTRQQKLEDMVANTPDNYILVTDFNGLRRMEQDLCSASILAVDTETTGVNVWLDEIVGISFSNPDTNNHYYVPLRHDEFGFYSSPRQMYPNHCDDKSIQFVKHIIQKVLKRPMDKIFHNATFDLHILRNAGFTINGNVHDTLVLMHILNENEPSFRLKDLATKYLKVPSDTFDSLFGKDCKFNTVELKYARYYACKDTAITYDLFVYLKKYMEVTNVWEYYMNVEQPLIRVVERMEMVGLTVDTTELERQLVHSKARIDELELELRKVLGDINFNSHMQLTEVLHDLGIMVKSTAKADLKTWSDKPIIAKILEYKSEVKHLTGFLEKIPSTMVKGRVYGSFVSTGTKTGRFSSRNPNLQQIPQLARNLYVAGEGRAILSMDWSKQEIVVLAELADEPFLKETFETGLDIYSMMASKLFKKPYEECGDGSKYRKDVKALVLGLLYGLGTGSLAKQLGVSNKEAVEISDDFFSNFKNIKKYMDDNITHLKAKGFVKIMGGRKRRIPEINSYDPSERARAVRQGACNASVQGSSSVMCKVTLVALDKWCQEKQKQGRRFDIQMIIHDEAIVLCEEDVTKEELEELNYIMCNSFPMSVKIASDMAIGSCWGKLEPINLEDWR